MNKTTYLIRNATGEYYATVRDDEVLALPPGAWKAPVKIEAARNYPRDPQTRQGLVHKEDGIENV